MRQTGQCAQVLPNVLIIMMNDGAVQNDYHNHRFVQRPKNAKADAAIPASKQYKPQLQQLHCSFCNQANGPCSRSEAPGSAPDVYEHTTVCFEAPTNPHMGGWYPGRFQEALTAMCKTAPGQEKHEAIDLCVLWFL